jgi:hypothetical protein
MYKFGHIDLGGGQWYYFVWSKVKPDINEMYCDYFNKFNDSIQEDSMRFWRTVKKLTCNLRRENGRAKD